MGPPCIGVAPAAKPHRACKALHATTFLGGSADFAAQTPGASAKFPAAKFSTANLFSHEAPCPPPFVTITRQLQCVGNREQGTAEVSEPLTH